MKTNTDFKNNSRSEPWFLTLGIGKEKDSFITDLSMMLEAGIPIIEALIALKKQTASTRLIKIIEQLEEDISGGMQVWQAFLNSTLLPEYAIALIRVGEESGRLNDNLKLIASQEQKDKLLKQRLSSSMSYPILVLSLTAIIGVSLAWFILPRLAGVFVNLKLKLPLPTRMLLSATHFLNNWGSLAIPVFIFTFAIFIYILFFQKKTKFLGQALLLKTPGIQTLILETELSRFSYLLATMLRSGIPIVESLELIAKSANFRVYKNIYLALRDNLEEGNSFQKAFLTLPKAKQYFPPHVQQMLISAEQSGKLEDTLFVIAKNTEEKSEISTKNLSVILEPVLLVVVWLGVAFVALAIVLPIYNLIGGLNTP
ncbi:MAG: type II secretion system F family protein [Candidatus Doudnabacteria bacterium]|nr:type II secretion system F family protein [Candidatus Doudnabacteria bacterium]